MAFVRWRGHCAQLLVTEYREGRSHQRCLANLRGAYAVPVTLRAEIRQQYPELRIDWAAIDRALAAGPPQAQPLSPQQISWLDVESQLRAWAEGAQGYPHERSQLQQAADVLLHWRAREPGGNDT